MKTIVLHADLVEGVGISKSRIEQINDDIKGMVEVLNLIGHECVEISDLGEDYLKDEDAVIIYHQSIYWEEAIKFLGTLNNKIIIRYLRGDQGTINKLKEACPQATWLAVSEHSKRNLWRIKDSQIRVCPLFNTIEDKAKIPSKALIGTILKSSNNINLLYISHTDVVQDKEQRLKFLIEVLRHYTATYDANIRLHIIGVAATEDGATGFKEVDKYLWRSNLKNYVSYTGDLQTGEKNAYLDNADMLISDGDARHFAYEVAEAQCHKLPIVALRYNANPDSLGVNQLAIAYDAADMAAAIRVVATNNDIKSYLIEEGYTNFVNRYSYEAVKQQFVKAYEWSTGLGIGSETVALLTQTEVTNTEVTNREITNREIINTEITSTEITQTGSTNTKQVKSPKVAFVAPWFGEKVPGGAEMELRMTVKSLRAAGMEVEILTTRVREFTADWNEDFYPAGTEYIWNVPITRFDVRKRDAAAFDSVNIHLMQHEKINEEQSEIFVKEMINSPKLYEFIREQKDRYDLFVFIPYMFGTTYYGIRECYDKAVMIPCFHDEAYAYMPNFVREFSKVAGMIYNAYPEKVLANRLYNLQNTEEIVMGIGMDTDITYDADRFRTKYKIDSPFIIYAGRKDMGKGVDTLIEYFEKYKGKYDDDMKLVLIGGGTVEVPDNIKSDVIDLGFVDIQDKYDACAAALCLAQLSPNESFSFVIMESWLCQRPVIVNKKCAVTTDFAERFEGGRAIDGYSEFEAAVRFYIENPDEAHQMALNGSSNVKEAFDWDKIIANYKEFFARVIAKTSKA